MDSNQDTEYMAIFFDFKLYEKKIENLKDGKQFSIQKKISMLIMHNGKLET